jgi:hypothetical protein
MSKEFDGNKHSFSFLPSLERTFDVFQIHLIPLEIKNIILTNSFVGFFVLVVISKNPSCIL